MSGSIVTGPIHLTLSAYYESNDVMALGISIACLLVLDILVS